MHIINQNEMAKNGQGVPNDVQLRPQNIDIEGDRSEQTIEYGGDGLYITHEGMVSLLSAFCLMSEEKMRTVTKVETMTATSETERTTVPSTERRMVSNDSSTRSNTSSKPPLRMSLIDRSCVVMASVVAVFSVMLATGTMFS